MTKNHRGGLTGSASTTAGCIKDAVQVAAIQRYVSKLHPDLDRLFQRARAPAGMLVSENDECWFMRLPLSHNLLDGMMKGLSHAAGTSRDYTNHYLRVTSVVHMKQNGAEDRKICAVTGHKNIASLSSYDIVTSHEAGVLADAIDLKPPSYESACPEAPVATVVYEPAFAAVDTDSLGAASTCTGTGFMLHAAGASFSNVTFNVMPRLSLNRKRRREQKAFAIPNLSQKE